MAAEEKQRNKEREKKKIHPSQSVPVSSTLVPLGKTDETDQDLNTDSDGGSDPAGRQAR